MKKITLATLIALCSATVFAQQPGGFNGPSAQEPQTQSATQGGFTGTTALSTVKDAQTMKDDQWVMLEGFIDQRIDHDKYIFRDNTGTLNVEIDGKRWQGQNVSPKDKIRIEGKVDKDWNSVEVDVKSVKLIK
ncbi:YgiW/YdeI family stress tolerance OB fold protein [Rahnella aquatilis]|uniref:YgiW/YdeI family stress tolerance OB fold protein n=1 Tax=Rahnella aquatilis TaxID=34038 RepID=UPI00364F0C95